MTESLAAACDRPARLHHECAYGLAPLLRRRLRSRRSRQAAKPIVSKHFWSPFFSGLAYEQKGMIAEAVDRLDEAVRRSPDSTYPVAALGHARALAGETDRLAGCSRISGTSRGAVSFPPMTSRSFTSASARSRQAIELLELAFEERSSWLLHLNVDPRLAPFAATAAFSISSGESGSRHESSVPTRSCPRSARAGWGRSTGRGTRGSTGPSRSRVAPSVVGFAHLPRSSECVLRRSF